MKTAGQLLTAKGHDVWQLLILSGYNIMLI